MINEPKITMQADPENNIYYLNCYLRALILAKNEIDECPGCGQKSEHTNGVCGNCGHVE